MNNRLVIKANAIDTKISSTSALVTDDDDDDDDELFL